MLWEHTLRDSGFSFVFQKCLEMIILNRRFVNNISVLSNVDEPFSACRTCASDGHGGRPVFPDERSGANVRTTQDCAHLPWVRDHWELGFSHIRSLQSRVRTRWCSVWTFGCFGYRSCKRLADANKVILSLWNHRIKHLTMNLTTHLKEKRLLCWNIIFLMLLLKTELFFFSVHGLRSRS